MMGLSERGVCVCEVLHMKTHKVFYLCTVLFPSLASAALFPFDPFLSAPASLLFSCYFILYNREKHAIFIFLSLVYSTEHGNLFSTHFSAEDII